MKKLIVIDDEPNIRMSLLHMLKGVTSVDVVGTCAGVASAMDMIKQYQPDIVISDVNLLDGTLRDIIAHFDKLPFSLIAMTASSESSIRDLKPHAIKILFKPFTSDELTKAIGKAVDPI